MVKKRVDYGFDGYRVPVVPRAPRSLRRRGSHRKSEEGSPICAFELLAAVAGKLLQESESSVSCTAAEGDEQLPLLKEGIKKEPVEGKAVRSECLDQGSYTGSLFVPELAAPDCKLKLSLKELPNAESDSTLDHASVVTTCSGSLKKVGCDVKLEIPKGANAAGSIASKPKGCSPDCRKLCDASLENGAEKLIEVVEKQTGHSTVVNSSTLKDPVEIRVNNHVLINSGSSVQMPFYVTPVPKASFPRHSKNVNISTRDDDENSLRCNQLSTKRRAFRSQSHVGYRRIRKMLTSRYWKVAPKLKDCELPNTSGGMKPFYLKRKNMYMRQRCQVEAPKRRKLWHYNSKTAYDQEASTESIFNSPEVGGVGDRRRSRALLHRGVTSSVIGHKASFQSKDPHVKFSIKSFKVPELYIEVPETETVGSLKRTVMEAVTAILGNELRVGVLLQGKKVRDDNRTLQQTGISQSGDLGTLGFTLEPSLAEASPSLLQQDPPFVRPCDSHQHAPRSPATPVRDSGFSTLPFDTSPVSNLDDHVEKIPELVSSPMDLSADERVTDSKALVAMSAMNAEALAMAPPNHKTKRSEFSQRRTRRPFSVSEVEALVEAVEKLGTGRWRDVKMRAFDDANHRTYVDLKDKWKTLVHTASIAPQQRRGEPVPQPLLDRVLAAHAYWSQHQSKQHSKHQIEPLQMSEAPLQMVKV